MKVVRVSAVVILIACGSSRSMAQLAQPADVATCKALGETAVDIDSTLEASAERSDALRRRAGQAGATHVVSEGGDATLKGLMYSCTR